MPGGKMTRSVNIMTQAAAPIAMTACCWSTISCAAPELARIQAGVAAAHPGAAVVLSCQRVEAYSGGPCSCEAPQRFGGRAALAHLAEVAAGLHSVVLGEVQILGQVRHAFEGADGSLRAGADAAIAAARELRRETNFNSHAGALLDRALRVAKLQPGGRLLVLGSGVMARLVAERGLGSGFAEVFIAARTRPPGPLASRCRTVTLRQAARVGAVEVVVGCLGSSAGEMPAAALPEAQLLVDLGTPRNFANGQAAPVITLADMLADEQRRPHAMKRRHELAAALAVRLDARLAHIAANASPVAALRFEVERVRQRELARMARLHPELPAETLDAFAKALVNQLFHLPSARLQSSGDGEFGARVAALFAPG